MSDSAPTFHFQMSLIKSVTLTDFMSGHCTVLFEPQP